MHPYRKTCAVELLPDIRPKLNYCSIYACRPLHQPHQRTIRANLPWRQCNAELVFLPRCDALRQCCLQLNIGCTLDHCDFVTNKCTLDWRRIPNANHLRRRAILHGSIPLQQRRIIGKSRTEDGVLNRCSKLCRTDDAFPHKALNTWQTDDDLRRIERYYNSRRIIRCHHHLLHLWWYTPSRSRGRLPQAKGITQQTARAKDEHHLLER